nr:hypothetical protein [Tanacetum cinerariifolium]
TKRTVYGADNPTKHALVVFINTKRILTVAGGCGAWRVVVMERVMVSAVEGGEDVGGASGEVRRMAGGRICGLAGKVCGAGRTGRKMGGAGFVHSDVCDIEMEMT